MNSTVKKAGTVALGLLLAFSVLALAGCQDRSELVAQAEQEDRLSQAEPEIPAEPQEEESVQETGPEGIDDQELIDRALVIAVDLVERAKACDEIYQGKLQYDKNLVIPMEEGGEYALVLDKRFAPDLAEQINAPQNATQGLKDYWDDTFTGERARAAFAEIQGAMLFTSINGELYQNINSRFPPLTLGEWDLSTFVLLEFEEDSFLARMSTTLVGQDNGEQTLRVLQSAGRWLLDDSYFLD